MFITTEAFKAWAACSKPDIHYEIINNKKLKIYCTTPLLSTPFWLCYRDISICSHTAPIQLLSLIKDFLFFLVWQLISVSEVYVPRSHLLKTWSIILTCQSTYWTSHKKKVSNTAAELSVFVCWAEKVFNTVSVL